MTDSLQLCRNLFHQLAVGTCELVQVKLKLWGWRRLKEIASEKQKKPTIRSITEIEEHTCMAGREKSVEKEIVLYSYVPPDPPPPSPSLPLLLIWTSHGRRGRFEACLIDQGFWMGLVYKNKNNQAAAVDDRVGGWVSVAVSPLFFFSFFSRAFFFSFKGRCGCVWGWRSRPERRKRSTRHGRAMAMAMAASALGVAAWDLLLFYYFPGFCPISQ